MFGVNFFNNTATNGGAIEIQQATGVCKPCTFTGNECDGDGSCVDVSNGGFYASNSVFSMNNAGLAGTLSSTGGILSLYNVLITENDAGMKYSLLLLDCS
jgi:predicted outer membrane repeat protein